MSKYFVVTAFHDGGDRMVKTKQISGATGGQYLYINVRGALSGVVVVQSHHPPSRHRMLTAAPPVPLYGEKTEDQSVGMTSKLY